MFQNLCWSAIIAFSTLFGWTPACNSGVPAPAAQLTRPQTSSTSPPSGEGVPAQDLLVQAQRLLRKGDFDAAIQKYQEVLRASPNLPEAHAGLARAYLKRKDVAQADAVITNALKLGDSPAVRVALGEVYFREGRIREAEHEWVKVINSEHEDARAYLGLARVRRAISMYKTARDMVDKAHLLDPTDPDISKEWMQTRSRAKRIKFLEQYLADETSDDAESRAQLQQYLKYLRARSRIPRGACQLVSKATTTETALVLLLESPTRLRGYGLEVTINGKKSKLLLDTGASGITINRGLAERAAVTKLSDRSFSGVGDKGDRSGYVGWAESFKVGGLEFQGCSVQVIEQGSVAEEEGLIGGDVFSAFLVDMDFPNRKLRLKPLPVRPSEGATNIGLHAEHDDSLQDEKDRSETDVPAAPAPNASSARSGPQDRYIAPEMKSFTQVYRFGDNLLVPTLIGAAPAKLFLIDTGSSANLISYSAAQEVTKVREDGNTHLMGISGSVKNVYRADKATLQFGHLRQVNQDLIAFDLTHVSDHEGTEVSGMLGIVTLRMMDIKIDYRDGLVDFSFNPKH